MFFTQRIVFEEMELVSKRVSGSHTNLDEIQETTNKEPNDGPSVHFEIEGDIKGTNIPLTLPNRLDRGHMCHQ